MFFFKSVKDKCLVEIPPCYIPRTHEKNTNKIIKDRIHKNKHVHTQKLKLWTMHKISNNKSRYHLKQELKELKELKKV